MSDTEDTSMFSNIALIVVDAQPAFLKVIPEGGLLLRRLRFAVSAAHLLGLPVLFTEQVPDKLGPTDEGLLSLAPGAARLSKTSFSAADAEGFDRWTSGHTIEHYLLTGIETPVCVYQTAISLIRGDQEVTLLSDCLGARRASDAQQALQALIRNGAHCLPSETIFYSLLGDANHPSFRDYNRLVIEHA
jgi:nicotinamidase-related amidase